LRYITAKGVKVPILGFGAWDIFGAEGRRTMQEALALGYRHIDTAQMYGNEDQVGAAVRSSGIDRSELFITTKIDNGNHGREATIRSTEESLRRLATEYVDLLLIHWPSHSVPMAETLEAMAALKRAGKVRHLALVQTVESRTEQGLGACRGSRGEHCIPNLGSGSVLDAKHPEFELILIRCMSSMPAIVVTARRKCLKPSIGPSRSLTDRRSCSIKLLRYLDDRISHRFPAECSSRTSLAARCAA
jgi:aryl-alcohol dehydrogenase-like predicted oxidoreductase